MTRGEWQKEENGIVKKQATGKQTEHLQADTRPLFWQPLYLLRRRGILQAPFPVITSIVQTSIDSRGGKENIYKAKHYITPLYSNPYCQLSVLYFWRRFIQAPISNTLFISA